MSKDIIPHEGYTDLLNFSDTLVSDICSPEESVVVGNTLFAKLDPRGRNRPRKGSVCSCLAETTKWPTTNSIAVFLVDMRLDRNRSKDCADAKVMVR